MLLSQKACVCKIWGAAKLPLGKAKSSPATCSPSAVRKYEWSSASPTGGTNNRFNLCFVLNFTEVNGLHCSISFKHVNRLFKKKQNLIPLAKVFLGF